MWIEKGEAIHSDLKNPQEEISNTQIPRAIMEASTGIIAIDEAIKNLYESGYMHNHMRMYVASLCCNMAKSHWLEPSKWMYANLLDGDIASNQLSWQWVGGTFSKKKYYANQDNINHFFNSNQKDTFLDIDYSQFEKIETPEILRETKALEFGDLFMPKSINLSQLKNEDSVIYNYYNLDPFWRTEEKYQRIFLLEPSKFKKYPVGSKCINFAIELSQNIPNVKIYVGEFEELLNKIDFQKIIFKEHPLNHNYKGIEDSRDWLTSVKGYYPSFFSFWKKCKKELMP